MVVLSFIPAIIVISLMVWNRVCNRRQIKRLQNMMAANDEIHRIHREHVKLAIEYAQCAHETGDPMFWLYSAEEFKKAEEVLG